MFRGHAEWNVSSSRGASHSESHIMWVLVMWILCTYLSSPFTHAPTLNYIPLNYHRVSFHQQIHQQTLRQLDRLGSAVQRHIGPQSPQWGVGLDRTGQLSAKSPQQSTDLDSSS